MGKKGGGGGGAPTVNIPAGLYQGAASESGLGQYATSLLNPIASMTNWAAALASGGNFTPIPSTQTALPVAGPTVTFSGGPKPWTSSFDPTTGLITFTGDNSAQQFTQSITDYTRGNVHGSNYGNLPQSLLAQWSKDYQQAQAGSPAGGAQPGQGAPGITGMGAGVGGLPGSNISPYGSTGAQSSALGPFLGSAWNAIQAQQGMPAQMTPIEQQTQALEQQAMADYGNLMGTGNALVGRGTTELGTGESMLNMATTGSGLFPSQAAFVEQAQQTGETTEASMLSRLGLSESTMAPQLKEQADLAAAGTAGQLVQGNISAANQAIAGAQGTITAGENEQNLAQAAQKIAVGAQALEVGEQQAVFDMYSSIASESTAFQQNLWSEAMSGYGMLGNILDTSAKSYGYSLQGYGEIVQAETATAQSQLALEQDQAKADSQSTSGLFGLLGSVLGGSTGSGGLIGALGGAGASAVGGAASAAVGGTAAAAGGGGAIAGIGGALTALFCQIAQAVYGFDDVRWEEFREWLLLRGPVWLIRLYGRHADVVADWIKDRKVARWIAGQLMQVIVRVF